MATHLGVAKVPWRRAASRGFCAGSTLAPAKNVGFEARHANASSSSRKNSQMRKKTNYSFQMSKSSVPSPQGPFSVGRQYRLTFVSGKSGRRRREGCVTQTASVEACAPFNRFRDGAPPPGFFWLFAIGELVSNKPCAILAASWSVSGDHGGDGQCRDGTR